MLICINCLESTDARPTDVGPDQGHQRDPFRKSIVLCNACSKALIEADVKTFHERYSDSRLITRTP